MPRSRANSILTHDAIRQAFYMHYELGFSQGEIAEQYEMSSQTIWLLLNGRTYREITLPLMDRYGSKLGRVVV